MVRRPSVELLGIRLDNVTEKDVIDHIISHSKCGQGGWVVTPNTDFLRQISADPSLGALVRQADLAIADGMPLVWASRLQGTPLQGRVPASKLIHPLCIAAAASGLTIFLLGGAPGDADAAAAVLRSKIPPLLVSGTYAPPHGFEHDQREMTSIVDRIASTAPDIVFCAFGFPKQERLMTALQIHHPRTWFIGIGGALTMVSGSTPPAPRWMDRFGLEWLHRLRLEPRRLFRRYIVDDAPFLVRLLVVSAVRRLAKHAFQLIPSKTDAPD